MEAVRGAVPEIIARLKPKLAGVQGIALFIQVRQDIQFGGRPHKTQSSLAHGGTWNWCAHRPPARIMYVPGGLRPTRVK